MKEMLSVLLVLAMLLVPVLSMTGTAEMIVMDGFKLYTHTDNQFTIQYPSDWTMLNAENIVAELEVMKNEGDDQLKQLIDNCAPQVQKSDMVLFLKDGGKVNVLAAYEEMGQNIPGVVLLNSVAPAAVDELCSSTPDIEFLDKGSLLNYGGTEILYMEYKYEMFGTEMHSIRAYVPGSTGLCVLNYTCGDASLMTSCSESFSMMLSHLKVK